MAHMTVSSFPEPTGKTRRPAAEALLSLPPAATAAGLLLVCLLPSFPASAQVKTTASVEEKDEGERPCIVGPGKVVLSAEKAGGARGSGAAATEVAPSTVETIPFRMRARPKGDGSAEGGCEETSPPDSAQASAVVSTRLRVPPAWRTSPEEEAPRRGKKRRGKVDTLGLSGRPGGAAGARGGGLRVATLTVPPAARPGSYRVALVGRVLGGSPGEPSGEEWSSSRGGSPKESSRERTSLPPPRVLTKVKLRVEKQAGVRAAVIDAPRRAQSGTSFTAKIRVENTSNTPARVSLESRSTHGLPVSFELAGKAKSSEEEPRDRRHGHYCFRPGEARIVSASVRADEDVLRPFWPDRAQPAGGGPAAAAATGGEASHLLKVKARVRAGEKEEGGSGGPCALPEATEKEKSKGAKAAEATAKVSTTLIPSRAAREARRARRGEGSRQGAPRFEGIAFARQTAEARKAGAAPRGREGGGSASSFFSGGRDLRPQVGLRAGAVFSESHRGFALARSRLTGGALPRASPAPPRAAPALLPSASGAGRLSLWYAYGPPPGETEKQRERSEKRYVSPGRLPRRAGRLSGSSRPGGSPSLKAPFRLRAKAGTHFYRAGALAEPGIYGPGAKARATGGPYFGSVLAATSGRKGVLSREGGPAGGSASVAARAGRRFRLRPASAALASSPREEPGGEEKRPNASISVAGRRAFSSEPGGGSGGHASRPPGKAFLEGSLAGKELLRALGGKAGARFPRGGGPAAPAGEVSLALPYGRPAEEGTSLSARLEAKNVSAGPLGTLRASVEAGIGSGRASATGGGSGGEGETSSGEEEKEKSGRAAPRAALRTSASASLAAGRVWGRYEHVGAEYPLSGRRGEERAAFGFDANAGEDLPVGFGGRYTRQEGGAPYLLRVEGLKLFGRPLGALLRGGHLRGGEADLRERLAGLSAPGLSEAADFEGARVRSGARSKLRARGRMWARYPFEVKVGEAGELSAEARVFARFRRHRRRKGPSGAFPREPRSERERNRLTPATGRRSANVRRIGGRASGRFRGASGSLLFAAGRLSTETSGAAARPSRRISGRLSLPLGGEEGLGGAFPRAQLRLSGSYERNASAAGAARPAALDARHARMSISLRPGGGFGGRGGHGFGSDKGTAGSGFFGGPPPRPEGTFSWGVRASMSGRSGVWLARRAGGKPPTTQGGSGRPGWESSDARARFGAEARYTFGTVGGGTAAGPAGELWEEVLSGATLSFKVSGLLSRSLRQKKERAQLLKAGTRPKAPFPASPKALFSGPGSGGEEGGHLRQEGRASISLSIPLGGPLGGKHGKREKRVLSGRAVNRETGEGIGGLTILAGPNLARTDREGRFEVALPLPTEAVRLRVDPRSAGRKGVVPTERLPKVIASSGGPPASACRADTSRERRKKDAPSFSAGRADSARSEEKGRKSPCHPASEPLVISFAEPAGLRGRVRAAEVPVLHRQGGGGGERDTTDLGHGSGGALVEITPLFEAAGSREGNRKARRQTLTGEKGAFRFDALPPGKYRVRLSKARAPDGRKLEEKTTEVTLRAGEKRVLHLKALTKKKNIHFQNGGGSSSGSGGGGAGGGGRAPATTVEPSSSQNASDRR